MIKMNNKERLVIRYYKECFENREFDEQTISSFLIYVRSLFETDDKLAFPDIYEICDSVAHRVRDRGKAKNSMYNAIMNDYKTKRHSKEICGYNGINQDKWKQQWLLLGELLGITISAETLLEIALCIISMLQFSTISVELKGVDGEITSIESIFVIIQGKDFLSLCTVDNKEMKTFITYYSIAGIRFVKEYSNALITDAIIAKRIDGRLRIVNEYGEFLV